MGKDREAPRYAVQRGISGNFRREVANSDKRYSFCLPAEAPGPAAVIVTKSAINALSYATIQYENDSEEWRQRHYLSLGGHEPLALWQHLKDRPRAPYVVLALDNYEVG